MPKNNGTARKMWRKKRAIERAYFNSIWDEVVMPKARKRATETEESLARATLNILRSEPKWVQYDNRETVNLPRPN